jgi:hypothetical protein
MDSENKFWLRICGMATLILVAMIGACTHASHDRRDKWEKAVANGADPMVASCALFSQGAATEEIACLMLAQNRK